MEERLQKILSRCGLFSRREAEQVITAGRVQVNGVPAVLGQRADPVCDEICVDGRLLKGAPEWCYLLLHKPRGYVTTRSAEKGRANVAELVAGCGTRVYPVGRLDLNSEGLLLMTNDGALTQKLTHPSSQIEKEYLVRVTGDVERALPILRQNMKVDGELLHGAKVSVYRRRGETTLLSMTISEGKNRQIRRMCAHAGLYVVRLKRIREGTLYLGSLRPGCWRYLTEAEVSELKSH